MSSGPFLLDTSALLAWIEGEEGSVRIRELLQGDDEVLLPWPVLMETFYITAREGGEDKALRRYATAKQLPVQILDSTNEPTLLTAARLKARYSISMADALIAAFAVQNDAVLVHKDPEYDSLIGTVRLERLPYKMTQP